MEKINEPETVEKADEVVINTKKKSKMTSCCKCMFWTLSVVVGILAIVIGGIYVWFSSDEIPESVAMHLGDVGVQTFKAFDRNGDGYISIHEFEPLYHHLVRGGNSSLADMGLDIEYPIVIDADDEVITAVPRFTPLEVTSMMKESLDRSGGIIDNLETAIRQLIGEQNPLKGYLEWQSPNKKFLNIAVKDFKPFLPTNMDVPLGKVYYIVDEDTGFLASFSSADISSNRYFPPYVKDNHVIVHNLLTIFHQRPFVLTRFGPRGAVAAVRARNDEYIDIVFRIHAEFQINELPCYPFWFTPGQFTGHLVITRDMKHIAHFNMYVPNSRKLNVDMEWLEGSSNMVVDIGYMPEMSLSITSPSVPANTVVLGDQVPQKTFDVDSIVWTEEMSEEETLRALEVQMYPFKQVRYYNFSESLELAGKENKLMHHILLWGALDDQSC